MTDIIFMVVLACCSLALMMFVNSVVKTIERLNNRVEELGEAMGALCESIEMTDDMLGKLEEYLNVEYHEEVVGEYKKVK